MSQIGGRSVDNQSLEERKEVDAVGIASGIWALSIFLSRIMGLVREQIIGRALGASREADLYFASFTLPDFLNYLLAAGALSIVFIPLFLEYLQRGDAERGWRAFSVIANFMGLVLCLGILLLTLFARPLSGVVAPGFTSPDEIETLARLTRIILPAQFFHVVGGLLSAVLLAQNRHFLPAMAPLVYSASIIAGGLIGAKAGAGADGFAWGGLVGSVIGPFALPLYGCVKAGMRWYPILTFRNPDLKRYLWLSAPIMIGFSVVIVDEWIVKNQASYLGKGVLSYLQYGRTLMKVPIGVFGMAAGVAAYPTISRLVAAGNVVDAYALLSRAVRLMLAAIFAAQVCLTLVGADAAYLIWGLFAKRFTVADAQATGVILFYLCPGLSGWAAQTVISRGFYALGSTWLPTILGTMVAAAMLPVYVALRHLYGANGLALASSIAIMTYVLVLGWLQGRRFEREAAARGQQLKKAHGMFDGAVCLAAAAVVAIVVGLAARVYLSRLLPGMNPVIILLRSSALCALGTAAYIAMARFLGVDEIREVISLLWRRLNLHGKSGKGAHMQASRLVVGKDS